ncbi:MAG: hypothetical protein KQJ78_08690 [Deltaproteobacteria bacterium]|nr:hypothetical protein [Deltaproteobacteria bacterium]
MVDVTELVIDIKLPNLNTAVTSLGKLTTQARQTEAAIKSQSAAWDKLVKQMSAGAAVQKTAAGGFAALVGAIHKAGQVYKQMGDLWRSQEGVGREAAQSAEAGAKLWAAVQASQTQKVRLAYSPDLTSAQGTGSSVPTAQPAAANIPPDLLPVFFTEMAAATGKLKEFYEAVARVAAMLGRPENNGAGQGTQTGSGTSGAHGQTENNKTEATKAGTAERLRINQWYEQQVAELTGQSLLTKQQQLDEYGAEVFRHTQDEYEWFYLVKLKELQLNQSTLDQTLAQWADHGKNLTRLTESLLSSLKGLWSSWIEKVAQGEFDTLNDALHDLGNSFREMMIKWVADLVASESLSALAGLLKDLKAGLNGDWNFNSLGKWWNDLWREDSASADATIDKLTEAAEKMAEAAKMSQQGSQKPANAPDCCERVIQLLEAILGQLSGRGSSPGFDLPELTWPDGEDLDLTDFTRFELGDSFSFDDRPDDYTRFRLSDLDQQEMGGTGFTYPEAAALMKKAKVSAEYGIRDYLAVLTSAYSLYAGLSGLADENRSKFSSAMQAAGGAAGLYTSPVVRDWFGLGKVGAGASLAANGLGVIGAGYGLYNNLASFRDQGFTPGNAISTASNAYSLYNAGKGLYTAYQTWQGAQTGVQAAQGALSPSLSGWTTLGAGLTTAGAGIAGGIAGNYFISQTIAKDRPQAMYGAAGGAMAGATIGSIIPGIGTAIGAGLGALFGAIFGGAGAGLFGGSVKKPVNERLGSTERQYKAWTNLTNLATENPEYMRGMGSERLDMGRNTAFIEIDKSLKLGSLSQELKEMATQTDTGAVSLKNMLENLDPVKLQMGRAMEAYHDFNLQVKDTIASSTQGALEFDGYANSGQHLSEKMGELAANLGLPEEQTQALTGKVDEAITTWQQFGGSTDELTRKLENEFAGALLDSVQAGEESVQLTQEEQEAKAALVAELDNIIASREHGAVAVQAEAETQIEAATAVQESVANLPELIANTGTVGQLAAESLAGLNLAFETGLITFEDYQLAQEDIAERLQNLNDILTDHTRITSEAATEEEMLVAGLQNAAIVSQIQADALAQNGQAMSLLDAQSQALTTTIDNLLTVNSLDALQQREMVNLLLFQSGRTEELAGQYKRYQEIKEQLTKAHTMERAEVEKLIAEGRDLAAALGFTKDATEGQTDASNDAISPMAGMGGALEGVKTAVENLTKALANLPQSGTTWDWFFNLNPNGDEPPSHHTGAYIYHTGGMVGLPSFHTGGLAADEVLAILQKGEGVINKRATAALGGPAAIATLNSFTASSSAGRLSASSNLDLSQEEQEAQQLAEEHQRALDEMRSWDAAFLRDRYTAEQQAGDRLLQERKRQEDQIKTWEDEGVISHEEALARMGAIEWEWGENVKNLRDEVTEAWGKTVADFWDSQKSQAAQAHDAILQQNQDLLDQLQREYEAGAIGSWEEYQQRKIDVQAMTDRQLANLHREAYQEMTGIVEAAERSQMSTLDQALSDLNDKYKAHFDELYQLEASGTLTTKEAADWRTQIWDAYLQEREAANQQALDRIGKQEESALERATQAQDENIKLLLGGGLTGSQTQETMQKLLSGGKELAELNRSQEMLDSIIKRLGQPMDQASLSKLANLGQDLYQQLGYTTATVDQNGIVNAGGNVGLIPKPLPYTDPQDLDLPLPISGDGSKGSDLNKVSDALLLPSSDAGSGAKGASRRAAADSAAVNFGDIVIQNNGQSPEEIAKIAGREAEKRVLAAFKQNARPYGATYGAANTTRPRV